MEPEVVGDLFKMLKNLSAANQELQTSKTILRTQRQQVPKQMKSGLHFHQACFIRSAKGNPGG
jgi:hypothetical protein